MNITFMVLLLILFLIFLELLVLSNTSLAAFQYAFSSSVSIWSSEGLKVFASLDSSEVISSGFCFGFSSP